jgi:hypothetical protein
MKLNCEQLPVEELSPWQGHGDYVYAIKSLAAGL